MCYDFGAINSIVTYQDSDPEPLASMVGLNKYYMTLPIFKSCFESVKREIDIFLKEDSETYDMEMEEL
jgi:hypothetical protein